MADAESLKLTGAKINSASPVYRMAALNATLFAGLMTGLAQGQAPAKPSHPESSADIVARIRAENCIWDKCTPAQLTHFLEKGDDSATGAAQEVVRRSKRDPEGTKQLYTEPLLNTLQNAESVHARSAAAYAIVAVNPVRAREKLPGIAAYYDHLAYFSRLNGNGNGNEYTTNPAQAAAQSTAVAIGEALRSAGLSTSLPQQKVQRLVNNNP